MYSFYIEFHISMATAFLKKLFLTPKNGQSLLPRQRHELLDNTSRFRRQYTWLVDDYIFLYFSLSPLLIWKTAAVWDWLWKDNTGYLV